MSGLFVMLMFLRNFGGLTLGVYPSVRDLLSLRFSIEFSFLSWSI